MDLFTNTNYNFTRWRWHALVFSAVLVVLGLVQIARNGLPLGIDFSGGTIVVLKFQQPTSEEAVRAALTSIPGEKVVQQYGAASANEVLIRLPQA
jgi:preprotein translocase subunit SecF